MLEYNIREIRAEEVSLLDDFLYEAIFIPEGEVPPPRSIIQNEDLQVYVRDFGASPDDKCLVAEVGGRVVGAVWTRIMRDYGHIADDTPSLAMSLYKEYRGKGIGTALLRQMLHLLRRSGYPQVSLSVQKDNYAARMYQKAGFKICKETTEEYLMVCDLNFQPLTTKQITAADVEAQIRQLYETAFPEGEQIPWDDLMRLVDEMPLDFTAYYDNDAFIGFAIVYPRKSFNWYWYFTVRDELRGKGYGQQILTQLIDYYWGQPCVLDMEAVEQQASAEHGAKTDQAQSSAPLSDNYEQRRRRHEFYLRNGFRDTGLYRTYNDITMTLMMMGPGTITMSDWDAIVNELKQFWWPDEME